MLHTDTGYLLLRMPWVQMVLPHLSRRGIVGTEVLKISKLLRILVSSKDWHRVSHSSAGLQRGRRL